MNQRLFEIFYSLAHRNAFLDFIWRFSAEYLPIILTILFVCLLVAEKNPHRRLYFLYLSILSVVISSGMVSQIMRHFIESQRPFVDSGVVTLIGRPSTPSMPSGHMMFFFPIALAAYYLNRKWRWYFILGILLMGLARIVAGVHYPADILAGLIFSTGCFYLARYILGGGGVKENNSTLIS